MGEPSRDDTAETAPRRSAPGRPAAVVAPRPPTDAADLRRPGQATGVAPPPLPHPGRGRAAGALLLVVAGLAALVAVPGLAGDDSRHRSGPIGPISRQPLGPVAVTGAPRSGPGLPGVPGGAIVLGWPGVGPPGIAAATSYAGLAKASLLGGAPAGRTPAG